MCTPIRILVVWVGLAGPVVSQATSPGSIPQEGHCNRPDVPVPGSVLGVSQVEGLKHLFPAEMWPRRERFFFEGMRMSIGPCYRDYSPPASFQSSNSSNALEAERSRGGRPRQRLAGLPVRPDSRNPSDTDVALEWAWSWANRYTGDGHFGRFRLSIVKGDRMAGQWEGRAFRLRTGPGPAFPGHRPRLDPWDDWAAGGTARNTRTGSGCAFRQYAGGGRPPELFVSTSAIRKVRRVTVPDLEGPLLVCLTDQAVRAGLVTHGHRPQIHDWRLIGIRDLLAPVNITTDTFPLIRKRTFGPSGISFASDRWELRRILILEGRPHEGAVSDGTTRFLWYLDLQTLSPVYYFAFRGQEPVGMAYFVTRWSEDRSPYPRWKDDPDAPVRVLDQVAAILLDWRDEFAVRIESGNRVAVRPSHTTVKRLISLAGLHVR